MFDHERNNHPKKEANHSNRTQKAIQRLGDVTYYQGQSTPDTLLTSPAALLYAANNQLERYYRIGPGNAPTSEPMGNAGLCRLVVTYQTANTIVVVH